MPNKVIGISACFIVNARQHGTNKITEKMTAFLKFLIKNNISIVPICPEQLGGLTTPRVPSEIKNNSVVNKAGIDVTMQFERGANEVLKILNFQDIKVVILKQFSPSCGNGKIYNGDFNGTVISGKGKTTELLERNGISVYTEEDLDDLSFIEKHFNIDCEEIQKELLKL